MQLMAGRDDGDAIARMRGMLMTRLQERPPDDPLRTMFDNILQKGSTRPNSPAPDIAPDAISQMRQILRAARDKLLVLQARSNVLAQALGACAECWGTNPSCEQCGGGGRPGWTQPDPTGFAVWVQPAIRLYVAAANTKIEELEAEMKRSAGTEIGVSQNECERLGVIDRKLPKKAHDSGDNSSPSGPVIAAVSDSERRQQTRQMQQAIDQLKLDNAELHKQIAGLRENQQMASLMSVIINQKLTVVSNLDALGNPSSLAGVDHKIEFKQMDPA